MFRGIALLRRLFREFNRGIVQFTRWVGHLLFRGFLGLWSWARVRSWSHLLQALPAMAAAVGVVVLIGLKSGLPAHEIESRYKEEASDAVAKHDWGRVILCQDRLVQLGEGDSKSLYNYAIALDNLGRADRAMQVMKQIAPEDQQGYGEAYLWIAQRYFLSTEPGHRQIVIDNCKRALLRVGELSDHGNVARHLLGELYLRMGAEKEAKEPEESRKYIQKSADQFKTIVETWPHMHHRYAQVLRMRKLKQQSDDEADQAIKYFSALVEVNGNNSAARLGWADSLSFLGEYQKAIDVLLKAPTKEIKDIYKHALAETYLAWQQAVARTRPRKSPRRSTCSARAFNTSRRIRSCSIGCCGSSPGKARISTSWPRKYSSSTPNSAAPRLRSSSRAWWRIARERWPKRQGVLMRRRESSPRPNSSSNRRSSANRTSRSS